MIRIGALASPGRSLRILRATLRASVTDRVSLAAAGCAFFTTLAIFPAMSLVIALYGLALNPRTIEAQLLVLRELLPPDAFRLIATWIHHLVLLSVRRLGLGLGISTVVTLWSAALGTRALLATLDAAYGAGVRVRFLRRNVLAIAITGAALVVASVGGALLTVMPVVFRLLDLTRYRITLLPTISSILLVGAAALFIALLYRFGPSGAMPPTRRIAPGVILATLVWLIASALLTLYIDDVARFAITYGPFGATAALMLWLYLTFYAVLMGAELNAQFERIDGG